LSTPDPPPRVPYTFGRLDRFKISNLLYSRREIVLSVYSSLQGQRRTDYDRYSELAGLRYQCQN